MGGKIVLLPGMSTAEEFATLAHEIAHLCGVRSYAVELAEAPMNIGLASAYAT
jgi:hypothetical protein